MKKRETMDTKIIKETALSLIKALDKICSKAITAEGCKKCPLRSNVCSLRFTLGSRFETFKQVKVIDERYSIESLSYRGVKRYLIRDLSTGKCWDKTRHGFSVWENGSFARFAFQSGAERAVSRIKEQMARLK